MTQEAFEHSNWQAVLDSHRLESHVAAEWLRYGSALLHTLEPGPEAGAQRQVVLTNLHQALELVGVPAAALDGPV